MRFVAQREVEIFRKPVGLEEALLETGSAFEDPAFGEFLMGVDAGEHPAEDVVLLDNMRVERRLLGEVRGFRAGRSIGVSLCPGWRNEEPPS